MIPMLDYLFLGIVQGIFEWIPISSEGVLVLLASALGKVDPLQTALFLHLGTSLAVLVYFWKQWKDVFTLKDKPLARFILISAIVSLPVGFLVYKFVETNLGPGLLALMGIALLVTGIFQRVRISIKLGNDALAIVSGLFQGLAAMPGLSRSGSTIFVLSMGNLDPDEILKYSYMMSLPVVLVGAFYLAVTTGVLLSSWPALVTSFLVGLASLHLLISLSKRINFSIFAFAFGILCILGALLSFLS